MSGASVIGDFISLTHANPGALSKLTGSYVYFGGGPGVQFFKGYSAALNPTGNAQTVNGFDAAIAPTAGTITASNGLNLSVGNVGSASTISAIGANIFVNNSSSGTITTGYGVKLNSPTNSGGGTYSTYYGLWIGNPTVATTNYSIYSLGWYKLLGRQLRDRYLATERSTGRGAHRDDRERDHRTPRYHRQSAGRTGQRDDPLRK